MALGREQPSPIPAPVVDASIEGPSAEGTPGQRIRATLEYPAGAGTFDAEVPTRENPAVVDDNLS